MVAASNLVILRVAVRTPLWQTFDYLPPNEVTTSWQPGQRLLVPFGSRQVVGILLEVVTVTSVPQDKLKTAILPLDSAALLPQSIMKLLRWASDYYQHPIGEVFLASLPTLLRQGKSVIDMAESAFAESVTDSEWCCPSLNAAQQVAVAAIHRAVGFQVFCLQGVTGSGKTEVYLQAMSPLIAAAKQVLVLVPEIALTPQTVARFQQRFAVPVICLHSELTDKQRLTAWSQAYSGYARIVIGTRSSVFVPLPDLGMIVVDESHDLSFKQQSGFRYSARDVAIRRAQIENLPIILGSATPSLETLMNVKRRRYQRLTLPRRAGEAKSPLVSIVDLRGKPLLAGLSRSLMATIEKHLQRQGQVLLFLNRRGYAPTLLCRHCGWMVMCSRCDARLTLHRYPPRLHCHHCGAQQAPPEVCDQCQQSELSDIGVGTEQLELVLKQQFASYRVVRIDRDSTRKRGSLEAMLSDIRCGNANLLVGTQMLSKGHHFPKLTLVAVVDADGGLYGTDFRAMERMAQLLVQVAGRAGRETQVGEVIIQTHHPDNPLLQLLLDQGYSAFAAALLEQRQLAQLPPFTHLALVRAESVGQHSSLAFLESVKQSLSLPVSGIELLGPVASPMERLAGRYRAQLLLQAKNRVALHRLLPQVVYCCQSLRCHRKVRWSLDVDPQDML